MTKQQLNVRIPNLTRRQIDEIAEREAMTAGEVVALAIERLWQEMQKERTACPSCGLAHKGEEPGKDE